MEINCIKPALVHRGNLKDNIWNKLRGMRYIIKDICDFVAEFFNQRYLDKNAICPHCR